MQNYQDCSHSYLTGNFRIPGGIYIVLSLLALTIALVLSPGYLIIAGLVIAMALGFVNRIEQLNASGNTVFNTGHIKSMDGGISTSVQVEQKDIANHKVVRDGGSFERATTAE
jgi:hypothetical protein